MDPAPDVPWRQTLSLWADQVPRWLPGEVLAHTVRGPALYCPSRAVLDRDYAVMDTAALRDALPLGPRVTVERGSVDDPETLLSRAHRVIDCRGAGRASATPMQTAYGLVLDTADAAPALGGDPALFMDWRTDYDRDNQIHNDDDEVGPTFLYAIPLDGRRVLLEETCLAGLPAPAPEVLERRLRSRLLRRGVTEAALSAPLAVEEVRIPLMPPGRAYRNPRVESFGTAGGHGHAATGYSIAATMGAIPGVVQALATGHPIPAPRTGGTAALNKTGLRALVHADEATLHQLFGAFGQIGTSSQQRFLDGTGPSSQVAAAMWHMWFRMPARAKVGMAAAVFGLPIHASRPDIRGRRRTVRRENG